MVPTQLCMKAGRRAVTWQRVSPDTVPRHPNRVLVRGPQRQNKRQVYDTRCSPGGGGWGRDGGRWARELENSNIILNMKMIFIYRTVELKTEVPQNFK